MQEEHVDDVPAPKNGRDATEETGEESRDGERDIIIDAGHFGSPDLAGKDADETPEDDSTTSNDTNERNEEEGSCYPAGQTCCNGVEQIGRRLVVGRYLLHEGEHVRIGRHLGCEPRQTDAGEDGNPLAHRPVL